MYLGVHNVFVSYVQTRMVCPDQHDGQVEPEPDPGDAAAVEGQGHDADGRAEEPDPGADLPDGAGRHLESILWNRFGRNLQIKPNYKVNFR
jgi:hypothetical protein